MTLPDEGLEMIIEAGIKIFSDDFRRLFRMLLNGEKLGPHERKLYDETELFFYYSNWFDIYKNVDGEYIMNRIVEEERAKRRENLECQKCTSTQ